MVIHAVSIASCEESRNPTNNSDEDVLVDLTAPLQLHSKRLDRRKKKLDNKIKKKLSGPSHSLLDLPYDVFMHILSYVPPSSVIDLSRVSRGIHEFIAENQNVIGSSIVARRYPVSKRCFPVPVLLENVDPSFHHALKNTAREQLRFILKQPYTHIMSPNPEEVCTCMTCILGWNALSLAYDFNQWQDNLDKGVPIPMPERGRRPKWNQQLLSFNGKIVSKATRSYLWYARILEAHLESTVRSIIRQSNNKGNKRKRFRLTPEDIASGTDNFLSRSGPPTLDLPFHRDSKYKCG